MPEIVTPYYADDSATLYHGDCIDVLSSMQPDSLDCCVTDPPYELGFLGNAWDRSGIAFYSATWGEVLRVLKPGAYLAAFGAPRNYHRLACAIEDAGFVIRDCLMWIFGTGFPKSRSCLKPAYEPIILARKPGPLQTLNIDACRIPAERQTGWSGRGSNGYSGSLDRSGPARPVDGRWPTNLILTGIDESWSRYFYCPKASKADRGPGNIHPTVKPTELMRWLVRLLCPPAGIVIDPFAGSGSTGKAAGLEDRRFIGIEQEQQYIDIAQSRIQQSASISRL